MLRHRADVLFHAEAFGQRARGALNFWNVEILADFSGEMIIDFIVARYGGTSILGWIAPPGMISTFPNQNATVCG
jgi:hypothetical protein